MNESNQRMREKALERARVARHRVSDRDALLGILICADPFATAALARGDDLALLRWITRSGITDALHLAIERAWQLNIHWAAIAEAAELTPEGLAPHVSAIYKQMWR